MPNKIGIVIYQSICISIFHLKKRHSCINILIEIKREAKRNARAQQMRYMKEEIDIEW